MYLSGVKKIDYKLFLEVFDHFHHIPSLAKRSPSYRRYSNSLLLYLSDFYSRRYPLHPTSAILKDIRTEFEDRWRKGDVPGWQKPWPLEVFHQLPAKCSLPLDMRADEKWKIDREDKLKPDGDEKAKVNGIVKNDKERLSVFCESCKKRFKKTVWRSHISGRKHKKNVQRKLREKDTNKKNSNSEADGDPTKTNSNKNVLEGKEKETAYVEFAVRVLKTLLSEVFEGTCSYIEKKLTRSYEEVRKELEEREKEEEEDVEKQDEEDLYSGGSKF
ncbi:hypothetical protein MHBO_004026 [Bonamia ostreae]|uniref:C2H2-type domain-containing protein n=1 Tax=Bonamia ostreae TaxID=126728 RepID=A0ABV2ASU9_9EUKA